MGVKQRQLSRVHPLGEVEQRSNEKCGKTDEEHDGCYPQPVPQQVTRFRAQMGRAAFDQSNFATRLSAHAIATRVFFCVEKWSRSYNSFRNVNRRSSAI
jgi:hypothetical protein